VRMHYFIPVCLYYFISPLKHLLSFRHRMSSHTEGIQIIFMFNIIKIGLPKGYMFVSLHYVSVTEISLWHLHSLYCWLSHSYTQCSHILFSILNVKQTFQGFHINLNFLFIYFFRQNYDFRTLPYDGSLGVQLEMKPFLIKSQHVSLEHYIVLMSYGLL
jgi:hypothetical protein